MASTGTNAMSTAALRMRPGGLRAGRVACRSAGVLLAALAVGCDGGVGSRSSRPAGEGGASGGERERVIIVGIDGADWRVIDPLVARGRLPAFRRLREEGATGTLRSMEPSASPSLWTTVATGVSPERHGIHGFVEETAGGPAPAAHGEEAAASARRGDVRPVTSTMRRAPAFWNILPKYGRKVGVVGWLVTWPAEPVDGFLVSSYLPYIYNWSTGRPLKGTIVAGIPRQTFPEGLIDELEPLKVKPAELDDGTVRRFYDPARAARLSPPDRECVEGFLWSLACDETYRRIGLRLLDRYPVDLFAIYFGGIDVASHRFWKFSFPDALRYGVRGEEAAVLGRVIEEYYVYIDDILAEYLGRAEARDTLVVLSDHGFKPVLIPGRPTTSGHHRMEGILALWGHAARRGHRIEGAGLLDVLPTVLTLLDVPIAMDLEGHVLRDALDPAFAVDHDATYVDSYGVADTAGSPAGSDLDENVLERLRSLGYIR
jgi:predicted AlkP superfamily phosphohydrolase/phosphomutase